jgi:hypothetical protein
MLNEIRRQIRNFIYLMRQQFDLNPQGNYEYPKENK